MLSHFGLEPERAEPDDAQVCVIGSVIEVLGHSYAGSIIGSGFINDGGPLEMPNAKVLALRGPLTAARLGKPAVTLGDAGFLSPLLIDGSLSTHARVGIVPHYKDKGSEAVKRISDRWPNQVRIIDVQDEPLRVIRDIGECDAVLSSSLHGLIIAEAFRKRTAWIRLSDAVIGHGYKFRDHYAAFDLPAAAHVLIGDETPDKLFNMATAKHIDVEAVQNRLIACFKML